METTVAFIASMIRPDSPVAPSLGHQVAPTTFIDLFAGAGLFSYAFVTEGFQAIQAVEQNSIAVATHRRNLDGPVVVGDVRFVKPELQCDVLIGGPPCQGFSTLGKRNVLDPRNSLCFEIVRWARQCKPKVIVVENVAAFLGSGFAKALQRRLRSMGYEVSSGVLNAADFGVPQIRLRSFIFASRLGRVNLPPSGGKRDVTVRQALKGLPLIPDGINNHVAPVPSQLALARMECVPAGGDKRDIMLAKPHLSPPSWWRTRSELTDVWGRVEWDAPCNTIRTEFVNPSKGRYIHPCQPRVISLREAARLHSIPDTWAFEGTPYQIARQIGNSVPPLLGRAVARQVAAVLGMTSRAAGLV